MKKSFKIIFILVIITIFSITNVNAANPYKESGPYGTNCTWYAWKMANEKGGVSLPGFGNAKEWYNDAKRAGYSVGTTPASNSIVVWGDWTSYGHVGYVERVEGDTLHVWDSTGPCIDEADPTYQECMANGVSEETDRACKAAAPRIACEYSASASRYTITGYIYLNDAPKKTTSSSSNTKKEVKKSNNANLSTIEISVGTIDFNKDIFEYEIEVENEIDEITINAIAEDKKATINGNGDYKLNEGLNEIKLTVTAEDNSTKEYIVRVTRKEEIKEIIEETNNVFQEEKAKPKKNYKKTIVIVASAVILVLLVTGLVVIKKKKIK